MSELPPGWVRAPLANIAAVQLGRQRSPKNHFGPNMRPYLRAANVTWNGLALDDVKEMNFSPAEVATFRLAPGDILLSEASGSASEVGKPAIWRGEIDGCCFQNTLLRVRTAHLEPAYLLWFFKWLALSGQFARGSRGVGIHHLGAKALSEWTVPIAPIDEQKRIVAAIEEQFSRLDAGVAALRRVRHLLVSWRSSLLAVHYQWQAERFGTIPLGDKIGNNALFRDGDWVESKDQDPEGQFRLTQLADVGDGQWRNRSARYMNKEHFRRIGCTRLEVGDVLIARMPDPLGRACLFPGDPMPSATVVDVAIIRPQPGGTDPRWLMWMINSPHVRRQIADLQAGTTRKRISRRNLTTVYVPDTPGTEQLRAVEAIDTAVGGADHGSLVCDQGLIRAGRLRSSILAAAFSGRLTPQDANDEPATALLERIAADPASLNGHKPTRTRKPRIPREKVTTV
jgi:type I restriction enzyme S subunit